MLVKYLLGFATLALTICGLLQFPIFGQISNDCAYGVTLIKRMFPLYSRFLFNAYLATVLLGGFYYGANGFSCIYIIVHLKIQMMLLIEVIKNITCDTSAVDDYKLVRDQEYQERITKKLIFCIQRHKKLRLYANYLVTFTFSCFIYF